MIWTLQWVAGQFLDAMVGRMVDVLGGGSRLSERSSRWGGAPRRDRLDGRGLGGAESRVEAAALKDEGLEDDSVKLVRYAIVSLRPCHERLLVDGSGEVLVTISMTGETFAAWIIACYLQAEDHPEEGRDAAARRRRKEILHAEKQYLRVAHEVLTRWPSAPLDRCETRELRALQGIRDAILERCPPPEGASSAPPELPPALETA